MSLLNFNTSQSGTIHDAQFDYYGNVLASASSDASIAIWNVSQKIPQFIKLLQGHQGPVWQLSWSHPKYGNLLASASYDHKIILWREEQPGSWEIVFVSEEHTASVQTVQFCPWDQGLHLAAGSTDGTISILSYNTDKGFWSRKAFVAHPNGVLSVSWAPSHDPSEDLHDSFNATTTHPDATQRLVSGGCDHQVRIWIYHVATNDWVLSCLLKESPHLGWVRSVAWRPVSDMNGSDIIASCSSDHQVILWKRTEAFLWQNYQTFDMEEPVWSVAWSLTGTVLSIVSGAHRVAFLKENHLGKWILSQNASADDGKYLEKPESQNDTIPTSPKLSETQSFAPRLGPNEINQHGTALVNEYDSVRTTQQTRTQPQNSFFAKHT